MRNRNWPALLACGVLALGVGACGDDDEDGGGGGGDFSGTIRIDGSSTVAPFAETAGERFNEENSDVRVTVGTSGTGGGFEKFCAGETDISNASREIKDEEIAACEEGGIEYTEIAVANDALSVVVNPNNPVTCLTVDQLSQIWGADSEVSGWGDVDGLDEDFDAELELFGPGTDSGTFDYFTEAINGEEGVQRDDYNNVGEDDNATVTGVAGSEGGMGYFGYSFFQENSDQLKALEVDGGDGCVAPSPETVQDGSYKPLGRKLFMYVSNEALARPEVAGFLTSSLEGQADIAEQSGFIGLTDEEAQEGIENVESGGSGAEGGAETTETTE